MELAELKNYAHQFEEATYKNVYVGDTKATAVKEASRQAVWNVQRERTSAIASKDYQIVQHKDFVHAVVDAISNLNIQANAHANNMGDRISVDISFPQSKLYVQKGEEFIAGIRIINSYNKTTGILIVPRLVRLVCQNGMVTTLVAKPFNIRHTSKLVDSIESAAQTVLKRIINSNDKLKQLVNACIADSAEWSIIKQIAPKLITAEKHQKRILAILKDTIGSAKPTRWDFYNAITNYCSHDAQLKGMVEERLQKQAEKLLTTPLITLTPKGGEAQ
jgi:hypothetical protein